MKFQEVIREINQRLVLIKHRPLTELEEIVLQAAWEGQKYDDIQSPNTSGYLRKGVAPKLWELLTEVIGKGSKIDKRNFREFWEDKDKAPSPSIAKDLVVSVPGGQILGGQPPDVSRFYGRAEMLDELRNKVASKQCVALVGSPGSGKSALAAKLVAQLVSISTYERIIWKSIFHAPTLQQLVSDLMKLLNVPGAGTSAALSDSVTALLDHLRTHKYLLILDSVEAIVQGNKYTLEPYGEQYANYGMFWRRFIEEQHPSRLVLISRKPLNDIFRLACLGCSAYLIQVGGLSQQEAMELLKASQLRDEDSWKDLFHLYRGNAYGLIDAIKRTKSFFGGRVAAFLSHSAIVDPYFIEAYNEELGATELGKRLIVFLAKQIETGIEHTPFSQLISSEAQEELSPASTAQLMEVVETLSWNGLLEKSDSSTGLVLSLPPMICKYASSPLGILKSSTAGLPM